MTLQKKAGFQIVRVSGHRDLHFDMRKKHDRPLVTILLGENGVGKSRLLGGMARSFITVSQRRAREKLSDPDKKLIGLPKLPCKIEFHTRGKLHDLSEKTAKIHLPKSLIAVSMSTFHKFPPASNAKSSDLIDPGFYHLIGTSPHNVARSPLSAALHNLLESFSSPTYDARRLAHVLDFMGYKRKLKIEITRRLSARSVDLLLSNSDAFIESYRYGRGGNSFGEQRIVRILQSEDKRQIKEVIAAVKSTSKLFTSNSLSIEFDLDSTNEAAVQTLHIISKIIRFGLAAPRDLYLFKENEEAISLAHASSGELVLTTTILGIANAIVDNSLILIDEPEISLHPVWQQKFLRLLLEVFSDCVTCHFIIATHAPLIVSEANEFDAKVVSMSQIDNPRGVSETTISGSIEEILLETFKVPTPKSRYLLERLTNLTKLAATRTITSTEFTALIASYAVQISRMKSDDPQRKLFELMEVYGAEYAKNSGSV